MGIDTTRNTIEYKTSEAARTVWARYEAFLANPDDPESNHKLRVSIRTLRSLIDFLSPWQARKQNRSIQDDLKRVVRETSRLREFDVLCELVAEKEDLPEEVAALCAEATATERARVLEKLQTKSMVKRLKRACRAACALQWKKEITRNGLSAKTVKKRFEKLTGRLRADLENLDETDYEHVHETRKRAKQVRYVSEQYGEVLGADAIEAAKSMKAEQDRLGALCDEKVNRELLEGFLASLQASWRPRR